MIYMLFYVLDVFNRGCGFGYIRCIRPRIGRIFAVLLCKLQGYPPRGYIQTAVADADTLPADLQCSNHQRDKNAVSVFTEL